MQAAAMTRSTKSRCCSCASSISSRCTSTSVSISYACCTYRNARCASAQILESGSWHILSG
eukprot:570318-Prymnesium_polylepis.1